MNAFPQVLNVKNKDNFPEHYYNMVLCLVRERVYTHVLIEKENSYFDLERLKKTYKLTDEQYIKMSEIIIKELEELGWKCKLSYGQTALFIYSTENPPPSCWDDSFV